MKTALEGGQVAPWEEPRSGITVLTRRGHSETSADCSPVEGSPQNLIMGQLASDFNSRTGRNQGLLLISCSVCGARLQQLGWTVQEEHGSVMVGPGHASISCCQDLAVRCEL